jgi:hypothetical protein
VLDGRPGDFQFLFTTHKESIKGRGLRRNLQIAASVDDPAPPYSFVIIEGAAQLSDRLEDVRAAAIRIGGRYLGEDRTAERPGPSEVGRGEVDAGEPDQVCTEKCGKAKLSRCRTR